MIHNILQFILDRFATTNNQKDLEKIILESVTSIRNTIHIKLPEYLPTAYLNKVFSLLQQLNIIPLGQSIELDNHHTNLDLLILSLSVILLMKYAEKRPANLAELNLHEQALSSAREQHKLLKSRERTLSMKLKNYTGMFRHVVVSTLGGVKQYEAELVNIKKELAEINAELRIQDAQIMKIEAAYNPFVARLISAIHIVAKFISDQNIKYSTLALSYFSAKQTTGMSEYQLLSVIDFELMQLFKPFEIALVQSSQSEALPVARTEIPAIVVEALSDLQSQDGVTVKISDAMAFPTQADSITYSPKFFDGGEKIKVDSTPPIKPFNSLTLTAK